MNLKISYSVTPSKKDEWPITALMSFGDKVLDLAKGKSVYKPKKFATEIYVSKNDWDRTRKLPVSLSKISELGTMETKIRNVFEYMKDSETFSGETFKEELDHKIKGQKRADVVKRIRFVDFIEKDLIELSKLSDKTKSNYRTLANRLITFEQQLGKQLYSNEFDERIYLLFMDMLRADENIKKINTLWSFFKDFRSVINKITRKYKIEVFKLSNVDKAEQIKPVVPQKAYLDWSQVKRVIDYKPQTEKLKNTKVMFLTLVFSGCRIGDVYKVVPEKFYDDHKGVQFSYARFHTNKGKGKEVIIPLLTPLMDAIRENGGKPASRVAESVFNTDLKTLMREAGFTEIEKLSYTDKHGKKKYETGPLYQFISSHTGRRSFITNLINFIPSPMLSKITAHEIIIVEKSVLYDYNHVLLLRNAAFFVRELMRIKDAYEGSVLFDLIEPNYYNHQQAS